jgi:hypothetical protein
MADRFIWGLAAHLVADFFLQNEWMALNKVSLRHPAAWVHSGIHGICFWPVFGWRLALALFLLHILIDTRVPLAWWRRLTRQTTEGPAFIPFAMWQDQALHVLCVIGAAWVWSNR